MPFSKTLIDQPLQGYTKLHKKFAEEIILRKGIKTYYLTDGNTQWNFTLKPLILPSFLNIKLVP